MKVETETVTIVKKTITDISKEELSVILEALFYYKESINEFHDQHKIALAIMRELGR